VKLAPPFRAAARHAGGAALLLSLVLAGCATPPTDPADRAVYEQNNDPLEPLNRKTLALNQFLDQILFRPIAKAYVFAIPEPGRDSVRHFLDNLKEPTLFFNNALQGQFKSAGITFARFLLNSSAGIGGLFDVATISGIDRQNADFGETLFVWGVNSGPYLILPIFGPSNPRDAIGQGVDSYADPITILANDHGLTEVMTGRLILGGVNERAQVLDILDDLEKNSVDFYAELRSLSQQRRNAVLHHGTPPPATPNLYDDPGQNTAPAQAPGDKPRTMLWSAPQTAAR
jgi:phospholipid-binding lipoprotein MlaA